MSCVLIRFYTFGWATAGTAIIVAPILTLHITWHEKALRRVKAPNNKILMLSIISNSLFIIASLILPDVGSVGSSYAVLGTVDDPSSS